MNNTYYQRNKKKLIAYAIEYYHKNREAKIKYGKEYRKTPKGIISRKNSRRRYNQKHKEQVLLWAKTYRQRHKKERSEQQKRYNQSPKGRAAKKRYWQEHKEKILQHKKRYSQTLAFKLSNQKYRKNNREKINKYERQYYTTPKGRLLSKIKHHKRRATLSDLTLKTIQLVYEDNIKKYGTLTCIYCLKSIPFGKDTLEHKIPLSRDRTNAYENLAIACHSCNSSKGGRTEEEYKKIKG